MKTIHSFFVHGMDAVMANVECAISSGIGIHLVGLPDISVRECLLRATTAMMAQNYRIPGKKIIVNIAPQIHNNHRAGNLDLPLALVILAESNQADMPFAGNFAAASELALDGRLRGCDGGVIAMTEAAAREGLNGIILSHNDAKRAAAYAHVDKDFAIYGVDTLQEAIEVMSKGGKKYRVYKEENKEQQPLPSRVYHLTEKTVEQMKVAATAGFNIIITGKKEEDIRNAVEYLHAIMPVHFVKERVKLYDICGREPMVRTPLIYSEPTGSLAELLGGGLETRPGKMSLAHGGILVLKNIAEWPASAIKAIRSVNQEGMVKIRRLNSMVTYPAKFITVISCLSDESCVKANADAKIGELTELMNAVVVDINEKEPKLEISEEQISWDKTIVANGREQALLSREKLNSELSYTELKMLFSDIKSPINFDVLINKVGISARNSKKILQTALTMLDMTVEEKEYSYLFFTAVTLWDFPKVF